MSRPASVNTALPCVDCGKDFDNESELNDHLKEKHKWTADEIAAGGKDYEVEEVVGHSYCKKRKEYIYTVKWKGHELTTEETKKAFADTPILTEYKVNNPHDDSEPPAKKGKKSLPKMTVGKGLRRSSRNKTSTEHNSESAPKEDDDELFIKDRKIESVLAYNYTAEKEFMYLVQFEKKENDSMEDSCRLIHADQLWKCHPEIVRTFFESNLSKVVEGVQQDAE